MATGLNYWEFLQEYLDVILFESTASVAGSTRENKIDISGGGFWFSSVLSSNDPDSEIIYEMDGLEKAVKLSTINTLGLTLSNNFFYYISKWDTTNDIYTAIWAPAVSTPFKNHLIIDIKNNNASAKTITLMNYIARMRKVD